MTLITAKFPNEIVETPIVTCEADRIVIKIKTTSSNPSHIYAEDYRENSGCIARNMNKIAIRHGECGMTSERMSNPDGTMYRMCVAVQIHPLFVTEADRSYCAQCVYMDSNIVEDLEQNIAISDSPPAELEPQFDDTSNPKCSYTIRKGSVDGPEIHFATIGESVFHVWQCKNEHVGILVQNCHVEDLEGNKILIIDQNGCGIDQYVLNTPNYSNDLRTAFQETHVFKFADKTMTRFTCQIRLCMKNRNNSCEKITPPHNCPNAKDQESGIVVHDLPLPPPAKLVSGFGNTNRGPPSITPPQKFSATEPTPKKSFDVGVSGTEFNGYSGYRGRRAMEIFGNGTGLLRRNRRVSPTIVESDLLPEMDVVGVIRVLDSPEDVEYYENRLSNGNLTSFRVSPHKKCMSTNLYWSLIVTLIALITIQLVALTVFALDRFVLDQSLSSKLRTPA
uniref:ZP domain-containing protein n=1 Tax=Panagrolaimus sp. JU765 TaxID=591449 RepID=A0AC34QQK9_9BILA